MWFIIFTKEGYNNNKVLRIIRNPRKEQRELRSLYLSGNVRKTLTLKIIEKIWNGPLCSENMKLSLSELPMNFIGILRRDGVLVRWYEI